MNRDEYEMSASEERVVKFVEKQLTAEEERALLDECAANDETRSLLKQHVTLSRRLASTLAGMAVPIAAADGVEEEVARLRRSRQMRRQAAARSARRGLLLSAIGGLILLAGGTSVYMARRMTERRFPPVEAIERQLPPPAVVESAGPAPETADISLGMPAVGRRRAETRAMQQIVQPLPAAHPIPNDTAVAVKPPRGPRVELLGPADVVKH